MRTLVRWSCVLFSLAVVIASTASAGETLFTSGAHELDGQRYYWLAEWKLEVTIPSDVASSDRFEVLFGSKGEQPRTLSYKYDGKEGAITDVHESIFKWIEIPLGNLAGGKKVLLSCKRKSNAKAAFLAGVRISGKSTTAPKFKPIHAGTGLLQSGDGVLVWADLPGFKLNDTTRKLWNPSPKTPNWRRAERSSRYAGIALSKVQRWLHERCLPVRDKTTGLFRPTGPEWNYRDTAADCYPFYVWAAYYTDKEILETVMIETLKAEQRLCNHLDRLPVPYDMDNGEKVVIPLDRMIFGASEYAKDGLIPIVEITGKDSPWFDRMRGLVDDIFKHAPIETPYGTIPSKNIEVNGELLQILPRLYRVTG
ncbi:MAG: hypothetical protein QGG09_13820, partial [Pirellulaceae bacterium]|nr:hypothetical protein [Pirellulaceae bacterium]